VSENLNNACIAVHITLQRMCFTAAITHRTLILLHKMLNTDMY